MMMVVPNPNAATTTTTTTTDVSEKNKTAAFFRTDLDLNRIHTIRDQFTNVVHIAAIGGWNGPHPSPANCNSSNDKNNNNNNISCGVSGEQWCDAFMEFNRRNNYLFDGVDWDLEGHDNRAGPTSSFTMETLRIVSDFSIAVKTKYERHNLIVSMAPAESYLDALLLPGDGMNKEEGSIATTSGSVDDNNDDDDVSFSLRLNLPPAAWMDDPDDRDIIKKAGFEHAGRQCYAYVLHRAGVESFDWIALQLYEAYSRFVHETTRRKPKPSEQTLALVRRVEALRNGFMVNLPEYGRVKIVIPPSKLVFGVSNGWADGEKFCKVDPSALSSAMEILESRQRGRGYRGAMFWTIDDEGNGGIYMSSALASALQRNNNGPKPLSDEF